MALHSDASGTADRQFNFIRQLHWGRVNMNAICTWLRVRLPRVTDVRPQIRPRGREEVYVNLCGPVSISQSSIRFVDRDGGVMRLRREILASICSIYVRHI